MQSLPTCTSVSSTSSDDVRPLSIIFHVLRTEPSSGSSLDQKPSDNVASVVLTALGKLLPDEVSLEVFNSQYLQQHSSRADAVFAAAKVSQMLGASREEVEAAIFNATNPDVELKLEARPSRIRYLAARRIDRVHCRPLSRSARSWPRSSRLARKSSVRLAEHALSCRRCFCLRTNSPLLARASYRRTLSRRRSRIRSRRSANRTIHRCRRVIRNIVEQCYAIHIMHHASQLSYTYPQAKRFGSPTRPSAFER